MLHHPVQPAMGKGSRWERDWSPCPWAAAGTVSFVIAMLGQRFCHGA